MSSLPNLTDQQKIDYLKRGFKATQPVVDQLTKNSVVMSGVAQLFVRHFERILGAGEMTDESSQASVQKLMELMANTFAELTSKICDTLKETIDKNNEIMETYGKEVIILGEEAKTANTQQQQSPVVSQAMFTERQIDAVMQQISIFQNLSELETMAPGNNLRDRLRHLKT